MLDVASEEGLIADMLGRLEVATDEAGQQLSQFVELPPKEAIAFFRSKRLMPRAAFDKLQDAYKRKAFTVAGLHQQYMLDRAYSTLEDVIRHGKAARPAKDVLRGAFQTWGVTGSSPHHLDTVFRNATLGAYADGRWSQLQRVKRRRPYWRYLTVGDGRVRESHQAMHGRVYHADDAVWQSWYPPNGHACRCMVESLSETDIDDSTSSPTVAPPSEQPDSGWAGSPAQSKTVDRTVSRLRRQLDGLGIMRAPKLAKKGRAIHDDAGDIGIANAEQKAKRLDRLSGMREASLAKLPKDGVCVTDALSPVPRGTTQLRVPVPSVYADAIEQLVQRVGANPQTASLLPRLRVTWQVHYARYGHAGPETVVADGIKRISQAVLSVSTRDRAKANALAEIFLAAEPGTGGSIRRAPDVARILIRGTPVSSEDYELAAFEATKIGKRSRLTFSQKTLAGSSNERIQITARHHSMLEE